MAYAVEELLMEGDVVKNGTDTRNGGEVAETTKQIRPFVEWLEKHKKGEVDTELTYELRQVIEAVMETGKAGELTLKIKIKPAGRAQQVTVIEEITAKAPTPSRPDSLYFVDPNTNLVRDDPRSAPLPFPRSAPAAGGDA